MTATLREMLDETLERFGRTEEDILFCYMYPYNAWFCPTPEERPYLIDSEQFLEIAGHVDPAQHSIVKVLILGDGFVTTLNADEKKGMPYWEMLVYDNTVSVRPSLIDD